MNQLIEFLLKTISKSELSDRQWALENGFTPGHVGNIINGRRKAGGEFIAELARVTNSDYESLKLAQETSIDEPNVIRYIIDEQETSEFSPETEALARLIESLPPHQQLILDEVIKGFLSLQGINYKDIIGDEDFGIVDE
jgi:hypothetical protein